jgi:antitoxin VapB
MMALNIKNARVERLASELASMNSETKTEAIRIALEERKGRLVSRVGREDRGPALRRFLAEEAWPLAPANELGRAWTREETEALLGYGPEGA